MMMKYTYAMHPSLHYYSPFLDLRVLGWSLREGRRRRRRRRQTYTHTYLSVRRNKKPREHIGEGEREGKRERGREGVRERGRERGENRLFENLRSMDSMSSVTPSPRAPPDLPPWIPLPDPPFRFWKEGEPVAVLPEELPGREKIFCFWFGARTPNCFFFLLLLTFFFFFKLFLFIASRRSSLFAFKLSISRRRIRKEKEIKK